MAILALCSVCPSSQASIFPWNSPYPKGLAQQSVIFSAFGEQPKTLDPAKSYAVNSNLFVSQIVEPPLQFHYLARPYKLVPLAAAEPPQISFQDAKGRPLKDSHDPKVAYTVYDITIKTGMRYHPHPAFAYNAQGQPYYHPIPADTLRNKHQLTDFPHQGTREATAQDFVYQIKRLASPKVNSPIYSILTRYIVGLSELRAQLKTQAKQHPELLQKDHFWDLRNAPLAGVKALDAHHYRITLRGHYPQFMHWLATPFFGPMPWEVDAFYGQPGMAKHNFALDWAPIGTGPYQLVINDPNRQMVLAKNPYFHGETFPTTDLPHPDPKHIAQLAGKALPFTDRYIFSLEKESIPRWHKFLQGYYDTSGISSDNFDQAIQISNDGRPQLSEELKQRHIKLHTNVSPAVYYLGFNMRDPRVGGLDAKHQALRQAIAIVVDYSEFIHIFMNGRGIELHGPIPPSTWNYPAGEAGINPVVYRWVNGHPQRRSLDEAKTLLTQAGYPNGQDPATGRPLVLHYDTTGQGPSSKAQFDWMRKQFAKLGIDLDIRATQFNRMLEKMRTGNFQLYSLGWVADYPDAENFLALLYGPNGKVEHQGENLSNYVNPSYDALYQRMAKLPPGPERHAIILKMISIARQDSPQIWSYAPKDFTLYHDWIGPGVLNPLVTNYLKYVPVRPAERAAMQRRFNQPRYQPLLWGLGIALLLLVPAILAYRRRQHWRPPAKAHTMSNTARKR